VQDADDLDAFRNGAVDHEILADDERPEVEAEVVAWAAMSGNSRKAAMRSSILNRRWVAARRFSAAT